MPGSLDSVMIKQKKNGVDNIAHTHTHTQNEFATVFEPTFLCNYVPAHRSGLHKIQTQTEKVERKNHSDKDHPFFVIFRSEKNMMEFMTQSHIPTG